MEGKRVFSKFKNLAIFVLLLFGLLFSGLAVINLQLPDRSPLLHRLSETEQIRLAEVTHLRKTLGDEIWPGWAQQHTPVLLYNEASAFLVGIENPEPGWIRIPYKTVEGTAWKKVDSTNSYYRQLLPRSGETPQAFIVQVGDEIAASMTTKSWTKIHLVEVIKEDLPNFLKPVMPYGLFINRFSSEWHITAILHESFHAFQAKQSYERVRLAESVNTYYDSYPWKDTLFRESWVQERQLLAKALNSTDPNETKDLARKWLKVRRSRRAMLDSTHTNYEQEREWLEGLAKYVELKSWMLASNELRYEPLPEMSKDPDFNFYRDAKERREQEILQLQSDLGFSESIFYYSGWAQAELLDRLYPDWKTVALEPGIYLDDLLDQVMRVESLAANESR